MKTLAIETNCYIFKYSNTNDVQNFFNYDFDLDFANDEEWKKHFEIDFLKLGVFFNDMLFNEDFYFLSIPEVSSAIFHLFFYGVIKSEDDFNIFLDSFLKSFFNKIDKKEKIIYQRLFKTFFSYNIQIFLRLDNTIISKTLFLFDDLENKNENSKNFIIEDLKSLYNITIKSIINYENKIIEEKKFLEMFKKDIIEITKKTSLFTILFSINFMKYFALGAGPLNSYFQYYIDINISGIHSKIEDTIKEVFNSSDKIVLEEYIEILSKNINDGNHLMKLENFVSIKNRYVLGEDSFNDCHMCQARVKLNDYHVSKRELEKL